MSDRFYTSEPLAAGEFVLAGPEAHHLSTVRRFGPGDRVTLFNGDGREYPAEVISVGKKAVTLAVSAAVEADRELGFELVVASALPKGDRADFLIEKLTELGATRFVPLVTERSVVLPKPNTVEKFHRAVIEACKQCGRNVLMAVDPPARWEAFIQRVGLPWMKWMLQPGGEPAWLPGDSLKAGLTVAVGAEGGFTPDEVMTAKSHGWRMVSLGPRVLRVETAVVAAAAWAATSTQFLPPRRGDRQ
jgi:16S rRNA (uracil1498-N3)-methyltransferase